MWSFQPQTGGLPRLGPMAMYEYLKLARPILNCDQDYVMDGCDLRRPHSGSCHKLSPPYNLPHLVSTQRQSPQISLSLPKFVQSKSNEVLRYDCEHLNTPLYRSFNSWPFPTLEIQLPNPMGGTTMIPFF
ncbi:hypothetical protein Ancab_037790 [Ancistrocladus abbreviatus]